MSLFNYMVESNNRESRLFGSISVKEVDLLPDEIDLDNIFRQVEKIIPPIFASSIEKVFIGDFEHLNRSQMNAMFHDGIMYISNNQTSAEDLLDDIVHEMAHAVEFVYFDEIYNNSEIGHEFKRKKMILSDYLDHAGILVPEEFEDQLEYSSAIDNFLYKVVGYEDLREMSIGLFLTPYSITSLREYWGIGFEYYFLHDPSEVAEICPTIHNIITKLLNEA